MFKHRINIQIRFVDIDAFNHINNANYLSYLEQARIKYLDDIIDWEFGPTKVGIILGRIEIDFRSPGLFKDNMEVLTTCSTIGNKSFTLEHRIVKSENNKEILIAEAKTIIVMFDYEQNKSVSVPEEWRKAINDFEGRFKSL